MTVTRRDLLKGSLPFLMGVALGGVAPRLVSGAEADKQMAVPQLPWPYKKLDSIAVAEAAYDGYYRGHATMVSLRVSLEHFAKRLASHIRPSRLQ
jgi:hypothetical protein